MNLKFQSHYEMYIVLVALQAMVDRLAAYPDLTEDDMADMEAAQRLIKILSPRYEAARQQNL